MTLQAKLDVASAHGLSGAAVYIDIANAFAEVERCLIVEDLDSSMRLLEVLITSGIDADFAADIVKEVSDIGFWESHGASKHVQEQLKACLHKAVATYEGVKGCSIMHRGTGAGNPLADILFLE